MKTGRAPKQAVIGRVVTVFLLLGTLSFVTKEGFRAAVVDNRILQSPG